LQIVTEANALCSVLSEAKNKTPPDGSTPLGFNLTCRAFCMDERGMFNDEHPTAENAVKRGKPYF